MTHAYPSDLAAYVAAHWHDIDAPDCASVPVPEHLEAVLSRCFQASMLRDEERPVTFRVALGPPAAFPEDGGPPTGLHRLHFARARGFDEHELRRLSPAATFHRSLIGVHPDERGALAIWGVIHSGPRWLQRMQGGRHVIAPMPPVPIVAVSGPGRLAVSKGSVTIGKLVGGRLHGPIADVFDSRWLPAAFANERAELWAEHLADRSESNQPWATLDPNIVSVISRQMLRRMIAAIRTARHGGALVLVPTSMANAIIADGGPVRLKYPIRDDEPRRRFRTLLRRVLRALATSHAGIERPVGWTDYQNSSDATIAGLDEAVFEVAHLIAAFAEVDGAVVLTKRWDIVGFGGEISGELPEVASVARAIDIEGVERVIEPADGVGTRHHAVYRFCNAHHDAAGIVVSQDGGARLVHWLDGSVTCWDQVATGTLEI